MIHYTSRRHILLAGIALPALSLIGCGRQKESPTAKPSDSAQRVVVYKNESCGCCKEWVKHLERAGFSVQVHDLDNLGPTKERVGIPPAMGSCHTAEVEGYFVEGHVPADDIKRLLRERPAGKGLTVPGMPVGSPGMEVPSGEIAPYDVFLVAQDGTTSVFAHRGG
jgi:hypothetical protein